MTLAKVTREEEYSNQKCLYTALELSANTWRLASSDGSDRVREKAIAAGDRVGLETELARAKKRFGLPSEAKVKSCYEAGRDGFWVHRLLAGLGIENIVVDAASMKVDRRARRVKSDRVDARQILADLKRHDRDQEGVWRVVQIPSLEEEDNRRIHRELGRLKKERTQHRTRILSLFATQGICSQDANAALRNLAEARTGIGDPLMPGLQAEILRQKERVDLVDAQIREIIKEQREQLKTPTTHDLKKIQALSMLRGVGMDSAWLLVMEFFAWRDFQNRRQVGGAAGLGGTPYSSGSTQREQGISKAGNARVRTRMVELAWLWLRYQPHSKLSKWYRERFASGGSRMRRIGIVAMARRLLIEFWHFVEEGVVPAGAIVATDR